MAALRGGAPASRTRLPFGSLKGRSWRARYETTIYNPRMPFLSVLAPLTLLLTTTMPAPTSYRSAMSDFWRFAEAAKHTPVQRVPTLFHDAVETTHPELFVKGVLGEPQKDTQRWEAAVHDYWRKVRPLLPRIRAVEDDLKKTLDQSQGLFRKQFPDCQLDMPVLIAPSMFGWDGTVRKVGEVSTLILSPDGIAAIHGDKAQGRLQPLVIHELFHSYQSFENDMSPPDVFTMLWNEGLASYATHVLLPQARLEDVLLSSQLATLPSSDEARLAREVLARLSRTDNAGRGPFFNYAQSPIEPGIPPRAGYLMGYRVAQWLGRTRSLQELNALRRPELEPLVRQALEGLGAGKPPPTVRIGPSPSNAQ